MRKPVDKTKPFAMTDIAHVDHGKNPPIELLEYLARHPDSQVYFYSPEEFAQKMVFFKTATPVQAYAEPQKNHAPTASNAT